MALVIFIALLALGVCLTAIKTGQTVDGGLRPFVSRRIRGY